MVTVGKVATRIPTFTLIIQPDLIKDELITQFPHILTNIAGYMDVADTRKEIATPRLLSTRQCLNGEQYGREQLWIHGSMVWESTKGNK